VADQAQADTLTLAQREGRACLRCESTDAPLHPGETITTRVDVGVVRDTVTALCTACVVADQVCARDRFKVEQQPARGRQPGLWAIRDTATGDLVQTPDEHGRLETEVYALRDSANDWIRRNRYLSEVGRGRP